LSSVFICHSSRDKQKFVERLAIDLKSLGHEVFYDEWSINPGEGISERITKEINRCDYFITVISKNSICSNWVRHELNSAIFRELEQNRVIVIPVIIGSVCDNAIPLSLRSKRYIDFRRISGDKYTRGLNLLLSVLRSVKDIRTGNFPIFKCPRCLVSELDKLKTRFLHSELDIICWENDINRLWKYDSETGNAKLYFTSKQNESESILFSLDQEDTGKLNQLTYKPNSWFIYSDKNEKDILLKIQFESYSEQVISF